MTHDTMAALRRLRGRALATIAVALAALCATAGVAQAQFGAASFTLSSSSPQAGAHSDVSVAFAMSTDSVGNPVGQLRTASVVLPAGIVGNPQAIEHCSDKLFKKFECSRGSQIGVLEGTFTACKGSSSPLQAEAEAGATTVTVASTAGFCAEEAAGENVVTIGSGATAETVKIAAVEDSTTLRLSEPLAHSHTAGEAVVHQATGVAVPLPLFNLQPTEGHVATFAASLLFVSIFVQVDVRPDGGLTATIREISTLATLQGAKLTLWGVPAEASHDSRRCNQISLEQCGPAGVPPEPFVTNPTDCSGPPLEASLSVESWERQTTDASTTMARPTGCEQLKLAPTLSVSTGAPRQGSPAGYEVDLKIPQEEEPAGIATPDLRTVSVALPQGTSLSVSGTNGLQGCTDAQLAASDCPDPSKLGSAEIVSPFLAEHLTGGVYLGTPTASERFRVFLDVSGDGVTVPLVGQVHVDEATGRLTAAFGGLPQLPFSRLRLMFYGGPTAVFANPTACGLAQSAAEVVSYGGQVAEPRSSFAIDEGPEGGACLTHLPFTPSFTAGVTSPAPGAYSPLVLTISRADGQQTLSSISAQLPPGLLAMLARVQPCAEAQAVADGCPQSARIGTSTIAAGAGPEPLYLSGPVYLTGPYDGAPFGLAITMAANAGPFALGTIQMRAQVQVNPHTLQMTIRSTPLPRMLAGVPLQLRTVNLTIDRPEFAFNPTSCLPQTITGTVESAEGASVPVSSPFQLVGCSALPFSPKLTANTAAKASSQGNGAGLTVNVTDPIGAATANLSSVVVQLPRQLRPRLSTIQGGCSASVFDASPAACPAGARVGSVSLSTPVLPSPLRGYMYLVVPRGAAPKFVAPLESDGVTAELDGAIGISSHGILSTAFRGLPDVPISSLRLVLAQGPNSMLGAISNLCAGKLAMPYTLLAANGAQIRRTLRVVPVGCAKRRSRRAGGAKRAAARARKGTSARPAAKGAAGA